MWPKSLNDASVIRGFHFISFHFIGGSIGGCYMQAMTSCRHRRSRHHKTENIAHMKADRDSLRIAYIERGARLLRAGASTKQSPFKSNED